MKKILKEGENKLQKLLKEKSILRTWLLPQHKSKQWSRRRYNGRKSNQNQQHVVAMEFGILSSSAISLFWAVLAEKIDLVLFIIYCSCHRCGASFFIPLSSSHGSSRFVTSNTLSLSFTFKIVSVVHSISTTV